MTTASAQVSPHGFDRLYGLELVELGEQRARGRVVVRDELMQADGQVHGGVYAAIAESLAVLATARGVEAERKAATLMSLQTSFLAPVTGGAITAEAAVRHRGRTTWVWEIELHDERGTLCAVSRATVAVTDASGPA